MRRGMRGERREKWRDRKVIYVNNKRSWGLYFDSGLWLTIIIFFIGRPTLVGVRG